MAVAGMIVAMTPRASSSPVALSSTTTPMPSVAVIGSVLVSEPAASATAAPRAAVAVSSGISSPRVPMGALLTSFTAFPHAVTSAPPLTIDGTAVADAIPADTDVVLVHTDEVTYRLTWGQVPFLNLPDGSVVFEIDGDLVAHVTGGVLLTITDD